MPANLIPPASGQYLGSPNLGGPPVQPPWNDRAGQLGLVTDQMIRVSKVDLTPPGLLTPPPPTSGQYLGSPKQDIFTVNFCYSEQAEYGSIVVVELVSDHPRALAYCIRKFLKDALKKN